MSSLPIASASFFRPAGSNLPKQSRASQFTARLALDQKTRNQVFALRYSSYSAGGYIDPRPSKSFSDPYDDKPNCVSLLVYKDNVPAASMRLCTLDPNKPGPDWQDIPAKHVFEEEIHALTADPAATAVEINRLVRHPDFTNDYELVFILFRFITVLKLGEGVDMMLSCVRRNHMPFYKRLEFETVAGPRSYPELKFTTNLMVCPSDRYPMILSKHEIFNPSGLEAGRYDGLFKGETVPVFGHA